MNLQKRTRCQPLHLRKMALKHQWDVQNTLPSGEPPKAQPKEGLPPLKPERWRIY